MDQQVTNYCLSNYHPSCRHYQQLAGAGTEARQEQNNPINRRRSIRIPSRHTFRFSEISGHDQFPGIKEDDAWTIDLSDSGVRFVSRQLLSRDMTIRFLLGTSDTAPGIEGTGRVVWCAPLESTPLFHAAIAFNNRHDPAALPHHRLSFHA